MWHKMVHASFRKVIAFDLLFLGLGIPIGAGLVLGLFTGDIYNVFEEAISFAR